MKLNRRHFLALSTATAAGVLLSRWAMGQNWTGSVSSIARSSSVPTVHKSVNGLLELNLTASRSVVQLGDRQAELLTYNGQIPGPRLEVNPGDTVRIHFGNQLSFPTNLHYHGLHVPPTGKADNPFLMVAPNEKFTYEFTIPQNHPGGTFWYHPHHHGNVAEQVFGGLSGLFIVRGELDAIPEIKAAPEEFFVLKDFDLDANGHLSQPNHMALMMGREGSLLTVNGRINPTISLPAGGWLRLRLLNASAARFYRLSLENHPFYLIATDGGAISQPVELRELLLAPGERSEILVQGDRQTGQYRLLNLPYDRGGMGMMGNGMRSGGRMGMMHRNGRIQTSSPEAIPLATFTYPGATLPALPTKLMEVETLPEPTQTRRIELSMAMGGGMNLGMGMGMSFLFNGKPYDPERIDAAVRLNTVEEWELVNVDPDRMDHPFHLHVNSFQIVSRNGQPEPYRAWKDTVMVKGGETVRIRIPFRDFAGKTVYHCHILDHEDLGMMGNIDIRA